MILILSRADVEALLDLDRLIDALAEAMADLSAGRASAPPRVGASIPVRDAWLGAMPAYVPGRGALAAKLVSVFPQNAGRGIDTHHAVVAVFDPETGVCEAIMDGTYLTAARTAAGSALATRLLARPDAEVLAVIGTGVQARMHARVIPRVRPVHDIRVLGRDPARAAALAKEIGGRAVTSFAQAASGAGIICAATHSAEPVVWSREVEPGTHIASVGFNPHGRELDPEIVARSLVVVESRASALAPFPAGSNDLASASVHAEIGEIVAGHHPGRTSPEQITLYKSVGVAVQDAVAARLVLDAARERGTGFSLPL
jgi:ornithine cyclodeaminase